MPGPRTKRGRWICGRRACFPEFPWAAGFYVRGAGLASRAVPPDQSENKIISRYTINWIYQLYRCGMIFERPAMSDPAQSSPSKASAAFAEAVVAALPGLTLTGGIALAAFALRQIAGVGMFSPMILATVIGRLFHDLVGTPAACRPGVVFSLKKLLRLGIILLGFQLMLAQVAAVGVVGGGLLI